MSPRPNSNRRISNFQIGLIAIVLTVFGFYLAFSKSIPFTGEGYQLRAVFSDAQSIRANSPVRIAGVDVGKVSEVEHLTDGEGNGEDAAVITMNIDEDAQPIREDATMQLRPRLFLEGNLFVDVQPGSPSGDELESGDVVPLEQTAISVQFDQVLTSLQAPVREQLQVFLREFGTALCGENPPEDGCEPGSGGDGFREIFRTSPAAFGSTAQVNEALLGRQPGDLAGFVRNLGSTFEALNARQPELQDLVTNLRVVTGSLAAESEALELGISELPDLLAEGRPALAKLNRAFPQLRAFAREALPGTRAANKALDEANPWIGQARQLLREDELRGLVKDLRPTIPSLARLAKESLPFLEESRALSSCFNEVIIPWANTQIPAQPLEGVGNPADVVFKETAYSLTGVSGESRSGDSQGQWFRVLGSGGLQTVSLFSPDSDIGQLAGNLTFPLVGAQPAIQSSAKTPFRPDQPCENQEPPNLGDSLTTDLSSANAAAVEPNATAAQPDSKSAELARDVLELQQLEAEGDTEEAAALRAQVLEQMDALGMKPKELPKVQAQLATLLGMVAQ